MTPQEMSKIINDLYLKDRTFICDDYEYSLDYLKRYLDLEILEYESGSEYWGWIIPDRYTVREAYIKDLSSGEIIVDVRDHPLHLASYSSPFEGDISFEDLNKHLVYRETFPEAIPSYQKLQYRPWEKNWMFSLSYDKYKQMNRDAIYRVKVDTILEKGKMQVARYLKKGRVRDTILLVAHLDHPGQVNDGLSGVIVELAVMLGLIGRDTYYSYLFLIVQEYIGSIAYLCTADDVSNYKMGIFGEMLCTGNHLQLTRSYLADTYIDRVAELAFIGHIDDYEILNFLEGPVNDEVVFDSPGIEIPFVSIGRGKKDGKMFKEYHTNLDNMGLINERELSEDVEIFNSIIDIIENDSYVKRNFDGFISLSNPSLDIFFNISDYKYKDSGLTDEQARSFYLFQYGGFRLLDGRHRISDIAIHFKVPVRIMFDYIKKMETAGLVSLSFKSV